MAKVYCVYIMTNQRNTVLYTGVTNALARRVHEHKEKKDPKSFASRYNVNKLLYVEAFSNVRDAIAREKQIKKGPRRRKEDLINGINPEWKDLSSDIGWW